MAKERFERRTLTGNINVACKFEDGTVRYWQTTKEEVVQHIIQIVNEYAKDGYVLTLRQLHYQMVTQNWIVNHISAYKKLGNILDDCRYGGVIDWDAIEDRGRVPYIPYAVRNVRHSLEDTIEQYRLDRQDGQKNHIELYTEKDALSGILSRVTSEYHIKLVVNKGYTSSSAIYSAYQRYAKLIERGKIVTVLYFGDHDPSGLDMVRDIKKRLYFMLRNGDYKDFLYHHDIYLDDVLKIVPIGLTMEQIKKYKLPSNPTKLTDSRAKNYIQKFGRTCWEVDALKPQVLTQIVETNIASRIDLKLFNKMVAQENLDIKELKGILSGVIKNSKTKKSK
jgi:hypothetical protein